MANNVNLDALIPREDFEIDEGSRVPEKRDLQISDLHSDAFFYGALRKPDFQRETVEWDARRVVGLIRSFINDELIPGIILWQNREVSFVIDGSHRLCALIAWVRNDYGDGALSQAFFPHAISDEQLNVADRCRKMVEKEFGTYLDHRKALVEPQEYGPDIIARAMTFGTLGIPLQFVRGDSTKAEDSFIRINQQAVNIKPKELELIKSRKKPNAIGARAIIRRGTGHKYWKRFDDEIQSEVENIATDLFKLIFTPTLKYPIKSLDLPPGGSVSSATALRMVYDFINLSAGAASPQDDLDGRRTLDYLKRTRRVMRLLLSNHESSIGLHPAIYFYSWTGKQQAILFLVMARLIVDLERSKKLPLFIKCRERLETFLVDNRILVNQIVRKFGAKESGLVILRTFYDQLLAMFDSGKSAAAALKVILADENYSYLQPGEVPAKSKKMSTQVKAGVVMRELLPTALHCSICGGLVPSQAISIDHKERLEDGGDPGAANAQVAHPYCNTGIKESEHAKAKKADDEKTK